MAVKLSIIVPIFNVKEWLGETLDSILTQSFKDFELILVDDGATDGSGEICDEYAKKDGRITVIHKENGGVSSARNAGLDIAKGDYIGWVDSDDLIELNMFARMIELAEKHDADIVQCQHDRATNCNGQVINGEVTIIDGPSFVKRIFTCKGSIYTNQVSLCTKIGKRELWDKIRFPNGRVYEDEMQTYKVCLNAKKIVEIKEVLYHYVKRENSIITGETPKKMLDKQAALLDRLEYLPKIIPELKKDCARTFWMFSINIIYALQGTDRKKACKVLISARKKVLPWLSLREKLSFFKICICK